MNFPTISFKFNDFAEARALQTIAEQKLATLEKFLSGTCTCEVEFNKVSPQHSGAVHRVEANLTVDGTLYRAEAVEESFEKALDEVRDELDKALRRAKGKEDALEKQAGRALKEQMLDANL